MGVNKNQVKGRVKEAQGMVKEVVGKVVGNDRLQAKGFVQRNLGAMQAKIGDVKEHVKKLAKGS